MASMQATTARACWCRAPGQCELQQEALPALKADDVLVRATHGAVSRGTESLVLAGRVPASEHARMRCPHMGGSFEFPVKYGYVSVGVVEACGKDVEHLRNARVFCLHPHQDAYVVPAADVRVVPPATPSARAVLAPNLETAINVVWDAGIGVGDRVAVVGAGVVGCLVAWVAARIPGVDVLLVDVDGRRRRVAEALGASFGLAGALGDGAGDRDVVVHASGAAAGAAAALALAGDEAVVVEASWHGSTVVPLPLGGPFHARRLTLKSSQVGNLPPSKRPRWDYTRRMNLALKLAGDASLDVLFERDAVAFEDLPAALPSICGARAGAAGLCHRVVYS